MGKGRPRAVEKGGLGLGQNLCSSLSPSSANGSSLHVPPAPVYYPSEEEFKDPLLYIEKIRVEAEPYGICRIVPPKNWAPPFALNLETFSFPTKTQAIHQLQARAASCDRKTFELEYNRFLEEHCGKKQKRKVVFVGEELDLCKLFYGVKRFGGYDKVVKEKKWGEVSRFVTSGKKISECAKHVLCQLYREHLYGYEEYYNRLNKVVIGKRCKRSAREDKKREDGVEFSLCSKRRRKNGDGEKVKVCKKMEEEELDQICEQCRSGLHGEVMLLCDRCDKGWHIYCLSPPLKQIPLGNWYCFDCLNSDKDSFGFVPGKQFTVEAFRRVADRARKKWFGSGSTSRVQLEKKFWEIVEGSAGEVEVMYGSDLDTSIYGSGFPRVNDQRPESVETKVWEEYCRSPWNLNNLPKLKGSMLRAVHQNITGVMVPWLYVGMLFSSFCWHFEDHCFYSMNYLHWGEPKYWYSVPGSKASAFEEVMRNSLPDLFEAQPDLLFQLVTMLNPSVLQNHGVPVYSVLQEAGDFVITFPRSYHGGFNMGLNCAEAVNFAPADWLPHGGFGAELYQMYHKTAVLSHEELLCVVAKQGDYDSKASLHLKKELLRIYTKEKKWRERLWRSGVVKSSSMPSRKCPEYVGTEEDQTCVICKQYLYLSAVVCHCRPSEFVCLEHWEHVCECEAGRLCLLYRHTLAELYDLILVVDEYSFKDQSPSNNLHSQSSELNALTKKVKGDHVTLAQLAEQWLLHASNMLQSPYSGGACATLLKEAEQFLWAGSEINAVRDVVKNLISAQKWAEGIRDSLSKIQKWSCRQDCNHERVEMDYVVELMNFDPLPCNEPGYIKLKEHVHEAKLLVLEIDSAMSSCSKMSELESLYCRVCNFPIYVKESEKLLQKISSVKVWIGGATKCISEKRFATVDLDLLHQLKAEILGLQVQLPETEMLLELLRQAELCQARCSDMLEAPNSLKNIELLLQELDHFTVNVPELILLKQCHADAVSWIARYHDVLANACEREDQDNVVAELNCLLKDGAPLMIQVDELLLLEGELKKACCREKALKVRDTKMPLDFIQCLITEAAVLQIAEEKLFVRVSEALAAAICWEERAAQILACGAPMSDFEDIIRSSADISVILPSLNDVKDSVAVAQSWLKNSMAFLLPSSFGPGPCSLLKLDVLKELVSQSKLLKISLDEQRLLEELMNKCEEWVVVACSVLQEAGCLLDKSYIGDGKSNGLVTEIVLLLSKMESIIESGLSLGFDFLEIPKLQKTCSVLQWCIKVLSACSDAPSLEDAESLMVASESLSVTCVSGALWSSLTVGVKWLRKALRVISKPSNFERYKLSDAEGVLSESQRINIAFPLVVDQLVNAIDKHKLWQEQADHFFSLNSDKRSWSLLLELKELGKVDAFCCRELDVILYEVQKIEMWKKQCEEIIGMSVDNGNQLLGGLQKIKESLATSLYIFGELQSCRATTLCISCAAYIENQDFRTCLTCNDCYHLQCVEPALVDDNNSELFICHYCHFSKDGSIFQKGGGSLRFGGRRPELGMLVELLSDAEKFSIWIEEREALRQVVEQALQYKTCLQEILDFTSSHVDKDLSIVRKKLIIALKVGKVAGVEDHQIEHDFELASARLSWRVKVNRVLEGVQKSALQQIQHYVKEGVAMSIPPEDYFKQKLAELKYIGLGWADQAKKVAADSGALDLDKVYELISEGENLPIYLEKELELLRARTMLYCICRKPYDSRAKVACDWCGEWYHIDCIKLFYTPKTYICVACKPQTEESFAPSLMDLERTTSGKFVEPKTPSPRHTISRKKANDDESSLMQRVFPLTNHNSIFSRARGIDQLWWRNRKPFRRAAKKRAELQSLSPFFHMRQQT